MVAIHGFVPWAFKYTSYGQAGGTHEPIASEWRFVQEASAYNAHLDADAEGLDGMANPSVFAHNPTTDFYPQNPKPTVESLIPTCHSACRPPSCTRVSLARQTASSSLVILERAT